VLVFADAEQGTVELWYSVTVGQHFCDQSGVSFGFSVGNIFSLYSVNVVRIYTYGFEKQFFSPMIIAFFVFRRYASFIYPKEMYVFPPFGIIILIFPYFEK